ncbi:unnamed protein product [Cuscuta epithymum]|uniref:Uncharacterized protein n=1 Tax=Cuscuta epithymum TaxID=186058 RepID=A0AAV0C7N2_9ASTE|nr:unnamed protein product [Cuscuta epithymum]
MFHFSIFPADLLPLHPLSLLPSLLSHLIIHLYSFSSHNSSITYLDVIIFSPIFPCVHAYKCLDGESAHLRRPPMGGGENVAEAKVAVEMVTEAPPRSVQCMAATSVSGGRGDSDDDIGGGDRW